MHCNYFEENRKRLEENMKDPYYLTLKVPDDVPEFSCHTGVSIYEPTQDERDNYCTQDFLHCPRLYTRINKFKN
jgi:hypothetical protein